MYNLVSCSGIFVLFGIAWLFSSDRRSINYRLVAAGLALQFLFAGFIFLFPPGAKLFLWINDGAVLIMQSATAGAEFVFGRLALSPGTVNESGEESLGFILAFQGLPTIIFFSALMSILYYVGIMTRLITFFAAVFGRLMRISGAEALCASANIFVGVESTMTVKPYLEKMTTSELMTVVTAGMATVASNVLAIYIFSLSDIFPTIAAHLISASFLSAPAAVMMAKVLLPETGTPVTLGQRVKPYYERDNSLVESIINGANAGVRLIVGIVALLIAVIGLVALVDLFLGGIGGAVNAATGWKVEWELAALIGYCFQPLALVIGVPLEDAALIGRIIGERTIITELAAYQHFAEVLEAGAVQHGRSAVICSYALCGFAHVASLSIFIGGISSIAPDSTGTLSRIGVRALVAATLACLLTACFAGIFYTEGSLLFQ